MKLSIIFQLYIYVNTEIGFENMLTFTASEERQNTCFKFIGADTGAQTTHLISNNTSLIAPTVSGDGGVDTCSFYSGPSDATIAAFGESYETTGSIAYSGAGESCGSIAYSGAGESCGSIASSASSFSSGGGFSGGCSYSC